jgi:hypothetical protein
MKPYGPISLKQVATAIRAVQAMSMEEKVALTQEIHTRQPNLLASCLVQPRLGVAAEKVDFLLNLLLVCFQAMKESRRKWPVISDDTQEQQMQRLVGSVLFSEDLRDPILADQARTQYIAEHPEAPLLAYVVNECHRWLLDLAHRGAESETDKFVMIAAVNLVNCIAHPEPQNRRA